MVAEGFVVHLADEHRFGLGPAAFEIGSGYARQEPLQRIAREGEIAVALRLLREGRSGASHQAVPTGPLLGDMLIERGLLRKDVYDTAMRDYRPDKHGRIGDYLVDRRVIPRDVVEQVVQDQRKFFAGAQAT